MKLDELLNQTGEWARAEGPHQDIVISSRVRLARNLKDASFPGWAKKPERVEVFGRLRQAVEGLPEMRGAFSSGMEDLEQLEKRVLVERHLISREHAAKGAGSGVVINSEQSLSLMLNEEDHLRMQSIRSGLRLTEAYEALDKVDSELEESLDFAFHLELGYLTACPTNVGTGMRASAMMHLPALALTERIGQVVHAVNKISLAVRGLYGEGSEALGNLFQISNQTTLGESERGILARLEKIVLQVIDHEQNARQFLLTQKRSTLQDQIGRSYGILNNAYTLNSKETLNLLSIARLGLDLGAYPKECQVLLDELFVEIQPAHLQKDLQRKLEVAERDELRAEIVRTKLKELPPPTTLSPKGTADAPQGAN
jgi:protein arginine kinase